MNTSNLKIENQITKDVYELKYTAVVRRGRKGYIEHLIYDYPRKSKFAEDIKGNGYRLITILTDKEIEYIAKRREYSFEEESEIWRRFRSPYELLDFIDQVLYYNILHPDESPDENYR